MAEKIIKGWLSRDKVGHDEDEPMGIHLNDVEPKLWADIYPGFAVTHSVKAWEIIASPDLRLSPGDCIPIEIVHPETGGTLIRRAE